MSLIHLAPIVEGHGEVNAVRQLLERTTHVVSTNCVANVLPPIRIPKAKLINDRDELLRAVDLATLKLRLLEGGHRVVFILLDGDDDPACILAPRILADVRRERPSVFVSCVIAVIEYETWFVAAAESLDRFLAAEFRDHIPTDPEGERRGKGWIQRFIAKTKYSETVDQVRLTSAFDINLARTRSRSFDKLCRELVALCVASNLVA